MLCPPALCRVQEKPLNRKPGNLDGRTVRDVFHQEPFRGRGLNNPHLLPQHFEATAGRGRPPGRRKILTGWAADDASENSAAGDQS